MAHAWRGSYRASALYGIMPRADKGAVREAAMNPK